MMSAYHESAWRPFEPSREAQSLADFRRWALTRPSTFCWNCRGTHAGANEYAVHADAVVTICAEARDVAGSAP